MGSPVEVAGESAFIGYGLLLACLLQFVLAGALAWNRSLKPTRAIAALLLVLNGIVAFFIAIRGFGYDSEDVVMWTTVFDAPTGLLILLLAAALWKEDRVGDLAWSKPTLRLLAGLWVVFVVASIPLYMVGRQGVAVWFNFYSTVPLFLGYSAVLLVLAWKTAKAPAAAVLPFWFLLLGFGGRAVEFAAFYGAATFENRWADLISGDASRAAVSVSNWALLVAALISGGILTQAFRARPDRRLEVATALTLFLGTGALGLIQGRTPTEASLPWYTISLVTLVYVRAIFTGLALERRRTLIALAVIGGTIAVLVLSKIALAGLFGRDWRQLHPSDALAPVMAVIAVITAYAVALRRPEPVSATALPAPVIGVQPSMRLTRRPRFPDTPDGRIARFWLQEVGRDASRTTFTHQELCQVAGVERKQLASYLKTLHGRLIDTTGSGGEGRSFWRENQEHRNSPKRFVLAPECLPAVARLLQERGEPP